MKTRIANLGQVLSLVFVLGFASCNKSEFYKKDYLPNPAADDTTTGSVNGGGQAGSTSGTGSTQGGVTGGVTGGTEGSATGGSSTTGGTTGGTTTGGTAGGSTTGGSTTGGSTTGGTTGGTTGTATGSATGGAAAGGAAAGGAAGGTAGGTTTGGTAGGAAAGGAAGGTSGGAGVDVTENFSQTASQTKKLDILWMIDDSGSMATSQTNLANNLSSFIDDFIHLNVDFKMAITTTDCSSNNTCGHLVAGSDTKLTSGKAQANEAQFKADFKNLVKVGTRGSGIEQGLKASEHFMQKFSASWLRSDAYLVVVMISDEEDQSTSTPAHYADYLKSFKVNAGLVKVYSIVDVTLSNANMGSGYTVGFQRYADVSDSTAGTTADIRGNFAQVLGDMGSQIINLLDSFALANDPLPGTLHVFVNNVETTNFTFDSASRSIKFNAGSLPPAGANVKVTYQK